MISITLVCARCTLANIGSTGSAWAAACRWAAMQADAGAGAEALGPYEAPEPADPDTERLIRDLVARSGFDVVPSSHGWRLVVPSQLDRRQAVYVGQAGTDAEGRALLSLVSVCGPANDRDLRILLKLNARMTEGHFAIQVLRGEEYFVVIENLPRRSAASVDPARSCAGSPSPPMAWKTASPAGATSIDAPGQGSGSSPGREDPPRGRSAMVVSSVNATGSTAVQLAKEPGRSPGAPLERGRDGEIAGRHRGQIRQPALVVDGVDHVGRARTP